MKTAERYCKEFADPFEDYSENSATQQVKALANVNGSGCHPIVELSQGCYHVTCCIISSFHLLPVRNAAENRQWDENCTGISTSSECGVHKVNSLSTQSKCITA